MYFMIFFKNSKIERLKIVDFNIGVLNVLFLISIDLFYIKNNNKNAYSLN